MENKEFQFKGATLGGFPMLFANILLTLLSIALIVMGILQESNEVLMWLLIGIGAVVLVSTFFIWGGFVMLEPGEARVMMFFGKYKGTFTKVGYSWVNPFINTKKLSLRARNLDAEPIKVNDKTGNPVMIGLVLVWKLKDTYKAMFEIDSQTMAQSGAAQQNGVQIGTSVSNVMLAFENLVKTKRERQLKILQAIYEHILRETWIERSIYHNIFIKRHFRKLKLFWHDHYLTQHLWTTQLRIISIYCYLARRCTQKSTNNI